jgi:hypothetical protein
LERGLINIDRGSFRIIAYNTHPTTRIKIDHNKLIGTVQEIDHTLKIKKNNKMEIQNEKGKVVDEIYFLETDREEEIKEPQKNIFHTPKESAKVSPGANKDELHLKSTLGYDMTFDVGNEEIDDKYKREIKDNHQILRHICSRPNRSNNSEKLRIRHPIRRRQGDKPQAYQNGPSLKENSP